MPRSLTNLLLPLIALAFMWPTGASAQNDHELQRVLARINQMRATQGFEPLQRHPGLDAAAQVHSDDMAERTALEHVSPRTGDPGSRVQEAAVDAERIAENIARHASVEEAYGSILRSDAHRSQLLDPELTHIGIAAARGADGVYLTQVMARIEAPAPTEAPVVPVPVEVPVSVDAALVPPAVVAPPPPVQLEQPPQLERAPSVVQPQPPTATNPGFQVPSTGGRNVTGYWVQSRGRWFYYPLPANAQPGQELTPDLSVQGPPPGYAAQPQPQARTTTIHTPQVQPRATTTYRVQGAPYRVAPQGYVVRPGQRVQRVYAPPPPPARYRLPLSPRRHRRVAPRYIIVR